jgi:NADH-ubiquinone oxidoreductase chain 5
MEGPTPVSALIHAATMVTAGVFLIIRFSPFFEQTPFILMIIVFIGSTTAFFASTIGLTQNDLKKVIAYSTCSQLGYMVMICGFSYYNSSLFHLINHGFFKALLFLSAGSVIHSLNNEQDMRHMGIMLVITPISYICIFVGSISLMGLPFLTGFYSKDLILELIYSEHILSYAL